MDREGWQKHENEYRTGKPEPVKEAQSKSTQVSRATSFMLTCASPNMPCGDYFPTVSDVTLLALPCFSPVSEYICLCPLKFRLSLWLFDKLLHQNFRGFLLMTGLCCISQPLQLSGCPLFFSFLFYSLHKINTRSQTLHKCDETALTNCLDCPMVAPVPLLSRHYHSTTYTWDVQSSILLSSTAELNSNPN